MKKTIDLSKFQGEILKGKELYNLKGGAVAHTGDDTGKETEFCGETEDGELIPFGDFKGDPCD